MEWPDRAGARLPADRIDIALTLAPEKGNDYRDARVTGHGTLSHRVARIAALRSFLHRSGYALADRQRMQGDASSRVYERVVRDGTPAILMNAPRRPDGPPVRDGKPYSAIAHLAEDVRPFVAMADALRALDFSAPEIYAADLDQGFLLLEDFGSRALRHRLAACADRRALRRSRRRAGGASRTADRGDAAVAGRHDLRDPRLRQERLPDRG